ncbi:MAG: hypothetical protein EOO77_05880 [Oxalobacteraceae bacterium]|nr:MAG: hypothetical protein EOO77_05880 [Oxalobacteraceae bacterium]
MLGSDQSWLQWRRSASTGLYRWFGTIFLIVSFIPVFMNGEWGFVWMALLLFGGTLLIEFLDRGYRVGYDGQAVYMRPHGLNWKLQRRPVLRIAFDDIASVTGERSARSISYGNRFTPFEFAHVYRQSDQYDHDVFALVGGELYDEDLRAILQLIEQKAPGRLDENVEQWLRSDRRF